MVCCVSLQNETITISVQKQVQKKKKKFEKKRGQNQSPPFWTIHREESPNHLLLFLIRHRSGGSGFFYIYTYIKTLKSGVCTICAVPHIWDCQTYNQESIAFRGCLERGEKNCSLCYQTHFYFLSLPASFQLISLIFLPHSLTPPLLQALLESALKHWSGVKCYVALDGSG